MWSSRTPEPHMVEAPKVNIRTGGGLVAGSRGSGLQVAHRPLWSTRTCWPWYGGATNRLIPFDNCIVFQAILKFHRPAERRKSWFIKECGLISEVVCQTAKVLQAADSLLDNDSRFGLLAIFFFFARWSVSERDSASTFAAFCGGE